MSFLLFACPSGKDKQWQLLNNIQKGKKYWKVTAYLGVDYLTGKQINVTIRNCNTKKHSSSLIKKLDFDNGNLANEHTRLTTLKKFIICGWTNTKTVRNPHS